MRKSIIALMLAVVLSPTLIIYFNACKKSDSRESSSMDKDIRVKINSWLDRQKPVGQPKKSSNIDLLKENLEFSAARYESLNANEQFLIVPVKKALSELKQIEKGAIPELILTLDMRGNILRGYVVLYIPRGDVQNDRVPYNTYHNLYTHKPVACDGKFRFLSVTGRRLYEYEIKNGKMYSFGEVRAERPATGGRMECSDWYLVLYYWENGVLVNQTSIYLGTTCENVAGGCDDPMYQTLCPDSNGGTAGNGDPDNTCCISDANAQWSSSGVNGNNGGGLSCEPATINPVSGLLTKRCEYTWTYNTNTFLIWTWQYKSIEESYAEKVGNSWKFINGSIKHVTEGLTGEIPPCTTFTQTLKSTKPFISADRVQARMTLQFENVLKINCKLLLSGTISDFGSAEDFWYAS